MKLRYVAGIAFSVKVSIQTSENSSVHHEGRYYRSIQIKLGWFSAKYTLQKIKVPSYPIVIGNFKETRCLLVFSVTRFGEIPPLWPIIKNLWQHISGLFSYGQSFNSLWHNLYAIGHVFIAENGQILNTQFGHLVTLLVFNMIAWSIT